MSSPEIVAQFLLDQSGSPKSPEKGFYVVQLSLAGADPATYAVTYHLHPTFYDPVREIRDAPSFKERIITYGDFLIRARVRSRGQNVILERSLSAALKESHKDPNDAVKKALDDIRSN